MVMIVMTTFTIRRESGYSWRSWNRPSNIGAYIRCRRDTLRLLSAGLQSNLRADLGCFKSPTVPSSLSPVNPFVRPFQVRLEHWHARLDVDQPPLAFSEHPTDFRAPKTAQSKSEPPLFGSPSSILHHHSLVRWLSDRAIESARSSLRHRAWSMELSPTLSALNWRY